jgi:hypothetical protein
VSAPVTPITRSEARKRWEAGLPIAMASTPRWFQEVDRSPVRCYTQAELGLSWADIAEGSSNNGTARSFARPIG